MTKTFYEGFAGLFSFFRFLSRDVFNPFLSSFAARGKLWP